MCVCVCGGGGWGGGGERQRTQTQTFYLKKKILFRFSQSITASGSSPCSATDE